MSWIVLGCIILIVMVVLFMIYKNFKLPKIPFIFGLNCNKEDYIEPRVFKNFISKEDAETLIKIARPKMEKSTVRGYEMDKEIRDSKTTWLKKNSHPLIIKIYQKISNITQKTITEMENLQVIHYSSKQYFKAHYDQSHKNEEWNLKEIARHKGPRLYTLLIYLNDEYKGGETEFPKLKKKFKLKTGDAVLFNNLDKQEKQVHEDALHSGKPILSGEKWAANVWIRKV